MALSTITIAGQTVTLVDMPTSPGFRTVQFDFSDPGLAQMSPFSGTSQIIRMPGASMLSGTFSLPPLVQADADEWISFLMACRGQAYAFMIGDPAKQKPRGNVGSGDAPVVNGANVAGSDQLSTRGWTGAGALLAAGDWVQIGYRLYRNVFPVFADDNGNATLTLWPSLREQPADGDALIVTNTQGLMRLSQSKRTWNTDFSRLTSISFQFTEWRGGTYA